MSCTVTGIADIEDFKDGLDVRQSRAKDFVAIHSRPKEKVSLAEKKEAAKAVPGTQTIFVKTFGCAHNVSDSEYMLGLLKEYGYTISEEKDDADAWLINSCTVKNPSQSAFMHLVNQGLEAKKPVIVSGCVPQADRRIKELEHVSVIGVQQIDRVVEVVEEAIKGNKTHLLSKSTLPRLDLPKVRKNPLVEIIPISTGCLGACTYCKTRHARGKLGSYEPQAIVNRVISVCEEGVKEVWLSSEDTGAYGLDIGTDIAELLRAIISVLPPDVMLRVGMTNPPYIMEHLDAIAECLKHPNVFAFLHVPVQAGSNSVLDAMKREYTVEEFRTVVEVLTEKVPGMTLATDIICGFPTETEEDFEETLRVIGDYKLAIVNISQFYPRPGTPAAKMKQLSGSIKKDRSRRLTKLFYSFDPYRDLLGKEFLVWTNTEYSNDGKHIVGHTKNYVKVLLDKTKVGQGECVRARVTDVARFHVEAEYLEHVERKEKIPPPPGRLATDARPASKPSETESEAPSEEAPASAVASKSKDQNLLHAFVAICSIVCLLICIRFQLLPSWMLQ